MLAITDSSTRRSTAGRHDDTQKAGIRGFTHTIMALDLLRVITTRDTIGAVIDADREIDDLGPIVSRDEVYAEMERLLDDAAADLTTAVGDSEVGGEFPFSLSDGFSGFSVPGTFRTFNRALRARIAAYQEDYDGVLSALDESFIDPAEDLRLGVFHSFSTGSGDVQNGLTNVNIFAHPSLETDAQTNGDDLDARFTTKVVRVGDEDAGSALGLASDLKFTPLYPGPAAFVPIIRNEELLLRRAEANWGNGDLAAAIEDLNIIRTNSGGLEPYAGAVDAEEVEDEILYNRRYSLMFEGGHRWIDARRFGRIEDLPLDQPTHVYNVRYPLPTDECDGRPNEAACDIGSQ
mgnify:CR=1 FL=1